MNQSTRYPILALALALLCGCAATQIQPIRRGEPVLIVVAPGPQTKGEADIHNGALGKNVAVGVGAGALLGGLTGLGCGPFAPLCVPVGAVAGLIAGAAAGAVVGVTGQLSDDKVVLLRERLVKLQPDQALTSGLQKNIAERAARLWNLSPDQAATVVRVELHELTLTSTRDERIRCDVRVLVMVQSAGAAPTPPQRQKLYEYVSPYSSLAVWLNEDSDLVQTILSSASQEIAAQIVADLST